MLTSSMDSGSVHIVSIAPIYNNYFFETEILATNIQHPMHILEVAKLGPDVATMPISVIHALLNIHSQTLV